ncbi:regulating synaptic membrane exocytosis protein 2-like [Saccoglossus kowalevskii]
MFVVQIGGRRKSAPGPVQMPTCTNQMFKSTSAHEVKTPLSPIPDAREGPMPDVQLDHLTAEEVAVLRQVWEKQEAYERAGEERIRTLENEIRRYEEVIAAKESERASGCFREIDLQLCRLCYSKKFADGVGRICCDCSRRVCIKCGSFYISADEMVRNKPDVGVENKLRCKMCELKRQLLCLTGRWCHGGATKPMVKATDFKDKVGTLEAGPYVNRKTTHVNKQDQRVPRRRISHQEFTYHTPDRIQLSPSIHKPRSLSCRRKADGEVPAQRETAMSERRRRMPRRSRQQSLKTLSRGSTSDSEAELLKENQHLLVVGSYPSHGYGEQMPLSHSAHEMDYCLSSHSQNIATVYSTSANEDERYRERVVHQQSVSKRRPRRERVLPKIRRMDTIDLTEGDARATAALQQLERQRSTAETTVRRVLLCQDKHDKSTRTNGFGMRVVGGKVGQNGVLGAYVTMVVDGGPARSDAGILEGDQILEWNGLSFINKTFEEVKMAINESDEEVNLLVAYKPSATHEPLDRKSSDNCENSNQTMQKAIHQTRASLASQVSEDQYKEMLHSPTTPRRKLPKSPVDLQAARATISGRLQLSLLHNEEDEELVISVFQAENLPVRQTSVGEQQMPNPYVKVYLLPHRRELLRFRTDSTHASTNPCWNKTFVYPNVSTLELEHHSIEFTVWDDKPVTLSQFMGEVLIDLRDAGNEPRWYDLAEHDENSPPLPKPSPTSVRKVSPCQRMEKTMQAVMYHARMRERMQRSMSISEPPPEEQSEEEEFPGAKNIKPLLRKLDELNVDENGASCNRRSSRDSTKEGDSTSERSCSSNPSSAGSLTLRNRSLAAPEHPLTDNQSQCVSPPGSPSRTQKEKGFRGSLKDILKKKLSTSKNPSLKPDSKKRSVSSHDLERYFDETGKDKRMMSSRRSLNDIGFPKSVSENTISFNRRRYSWMSPEERAVYRGRGLSRASSLDDGSDTNDSVASFDSDPMRPAPEGDDVASVRSSNELGSLGPGQYNVIALLDEMVRPVGVMKIGIVMTKGHLEVEVICAKGLPKTENEQLPDTYVKTYLVEGSRRIQKKKTRTVKQSLDPAYRQLIRYSACDVYGRNLQVMVWEKLGTLQHNHCLGEVQITLDELELCKHTVGWYTLFPSDVYKMGSCDSISSW